jgi:hypothetical protein
MGAHDKDHWDEWLDKALRQYGDAEPRPGLEPRILANLQAQQRTHTRQVWMWALGGVAVTIFAVLFLWHGLDHSDLRKHDDKPVARALQESAIEQRAQAMPLISQRPTTRVTRRLRPALTEHNNSPRLERFPSPRPLSPEELAVMQYAERYPQEAMLVAKEQQKFSDEVRQAQEEVETGLASSNE